MSAVAGAPPIAPGVGGRAGAPGPGAGGPPGAPGTGTGGAPPSAPGLGGMPPAEQPGMSRARKIGLAVFGAWLGGIVLFVILFGLKSHKVPEVANSVFSPTDEFKLETWFEVGPIAFNKGVLYLLITAAITIGVMSYIARRMRQRPGRLQVAVEWFYDFARRMSRENLDESMERK
ncbi:MAG: F0F1 ATP synthase subunit A, partial [Solirubrobacterales bacterium]|nr:F0F1 ATP synthase subunit A [Solirubrobacterales bacterium]